MTAFLDRTHATARRASTAFAVSVLLHAGALAAVLAVVGSPGTRERSAQVLAVTLAAAPAAVTAPAVATAPEQRPTPAPTVRADTARAAPAPRAPVVAVDRESEDAAQRRLRETLAAATAASITPPAHSGVEPTAAAEAAAAAGPQVVAAESAATLSGSDATTRGFVELHVLDWLAQHRQYPRAARRAGIEGTVHVRFVIDPEGRIGDARVELSSGAGVLDRAALALLASASPVPGLGQFGLSDSLELRLPIDYRLRRGARGG
jgi:protein TonB